MHYQELNGDKGKRQREAASRIWSRKPSVLNSDSVGFSSCSPGGEVFSDGKGNYRISGKCFPETEMRSWVMQLHRLGLFIENAPRPALTCATQWVDNISIFF